MTDVWPQCPITSAKRAIWLSAAAAFGAAYLVAIVLIAWRMPANIAPIAYYGGLIVTAVGPASSVTLCWLMATLVLRNTDWRIGAFAGLAGFALSFLVTGAVVYAFGNGWFTFQKWMGLTNEPKPTWRIGVQSMSSMMFWAQLIGPIYLGKLSWIWLASTVSIGALASKFAASK